MSGDDLLTVDEVSEWLRVPVSTLNLWRSKGRGHGLAFVKLGQRYVRYRRSDVEAYLKASTNPSRSTLKSALPPARRRVS